MKNKKTLYHFILDKSGSMGDVREQTVSMFNKQVDTIKELAIKYDDQEFFTGLTVFNDRLEYEVDFKSSTELQCIRYEHYLPNGMTALYDAVGSSIYRIKERFDKQIESNEMSVVIVVLTDGHENTSVRFDAIQIAKLIKELEATEKWSFSILGADFDITSVSSKLNFQASASRQYSKSNFFDIEEDMEESIRSYADQKSKGNIDKDFLKFKNK